MRVIAETKYKVGLCYNSLNKFDESIAAFKESVEYIEGEIAAEGRKEEQNEKTKATIAELEELKLDIQAKVVEVEENKTSSMDVVKREIAKIMNPNPSPAKEDAGSTAFSAAVSSTATVDAEKPKANDISHLIKRKKPAESSADPVAADCSSTVDAEKAKPTDISHLIKRKQPVDSSSDADGPTAPKRPAV